MAPTTVSSEIEVVQQFLGALERIDVDGAVALLHPDVVYQNVPFPPARGRSEVERQLRMLERFGAGFEVRWHNVAANGPIVLTERTDVITIGKVPGAFWVCGTFEVRDGLVVLWRDRFDFADFTWSFVRGGLRALRNRVRR
jgi:limonene-1,2-epoxide hydrolase